MPILFEQLRELLMEKLLILGKGQRYNQAVILAGGAGSGKGWVIKNVIGGDWKVWDPDSLKLALKKVASKIVADPEFAKKFGKVRDVSSEIAKMDLRNPSDVAKLHMMVKDLGKDDKQLIYSLTANKDNQEKPNIIIDCTLKSERAAINESNRLKEYGYKPENIHIVWVLTDVRIAVDQNYKRERRVFNSILFQTHAGAKKTMTEVVIQNYPKLGINGDVAVVLGGRAEMVRPEGGRAGQTGQILKMKKGFENEPLYLRIKKAGDPRFNESAVLKTLEQAEILGPKTDQVPSDITRKYPETAG
jgi:hypothetical protein